MSTRDPSWSSSQDRDMDELLALAPAEREARLAELARSDAARATRLREWLAAIEASDGRFDAPPADGRRFGPWRALRLVARGGMGEVYLGERADGAFERRVAIKRMRPDRATPREQLARERALLAGLDHPGIARLLDGGELPDGSPWLVTEWIDGSTLGEWIASRDVPRRARIALLRDVCAAVAYAHAHLVVHRDLKPANVMIDGRGDAHVVDFGIARALDEDRARALTDDRALTPAFAAPEQLAGGAITTRTDVYSLGVLLYWLLAGRVPHDPAQLSLAELVERVCHGDVEPPTRGTPAHDRDLDAIVLTAMAREPAARYASADALGGDLDRWLRGDAVAAREPTRRERVARFLRRYRAQSALAAALVAALVAGLAGTTWQARRAAEQRDLAQRERDTALAELERGDLLVDAFGAVLRDSGEDEAFSAEQWLDRAVASLEAPGPADAATRGRLLLELAEIELERGQSKRALPLFERVLAGSGVIGAAHEARAQCLYGSALIAGDRIGDGEAAIGRGLAIAEQLRGAERIELVECLSRRADYPNLHQRRGDDVAMLERALRELDAIGGRAPQRWRRAALVHKLALTMQLNGRRAEALARFREVQALDRELGTAQTPDGASTISEIAGLELEAGALVAASEQYAEAIAILERTRGRSPALATALRNASVNENQRGDHARAAALAQRSVQTWAALDAEGGFAQAVARLELARAWIRLGRLDAVEPELERVAATIAAQERPTPYLLALVPISRAQAAIAAGDLEAAGALVAALRAQAATADDPALTGALATLELELALARRDWPGAEAAARHALAVLGRSLARPHWRVEWVQVQLARALHEQGRDDDARAALAGTRDALARVLVPGDRRLAEAAALEAALARRR